MKPKNVTIKDIARAGGVSHSTVSRALNNHPAISKATRERIIALSQEMGYVPNATARGLKTNRTRALGVILRQIDDPYWSEVLDGVDSVLQAKGYSMFIACTHDDKQRGKEVARAMVERGVDGVILGGLRFSEEKSHILSSYDLPMVMINNEDVGQFRYVISNDHYHGARMITKHLIELGHTRLAYLGKRYAGIPNSDRLAGFHTEMKAAGLPIEKQYIYHTLPPNPIGGREGAEYFLSLDAIPSGIICYNDYIAVGVYDYLKEKGLHIPGDISIAGYDDIFIASFLSPPLTTFHQNKFEMGQRAAEMMLEVLSDRRVGERESSAPKKVVLRGNLKVRASTRSFTMRESIKLAD